MNSRTKQICRSAFRSLKEEFSLRERIWPFRSLSPNYVLLNRSSAIVVEFDERDRTFFVSLFRREFGIRRRPCVSLDILLIWAKKRSIPTRIESSSPLDENQHDEWLREAANDIGQCAGDLLNGDAQAWADVEQLNRRLVKKFISMFEEQIKADVDEVKSQLRSMDW